MGEPTTELAVSVASGVAVVTLDRPGRRNALTGGLMTALAAAMAELDADDGVGAIILTGRDPAFCAGLDLAELSSTAANLRVDETGRPWPPLGTPVIGAVNGPAVTGGLELVLHCDLAIASERATFADTHTRIGVMPGWGLSVLLPQAVGLRRARQMSFTGNYVTAGQALQWGLVNQVVPHAELLAVAVGLAGDICSNDRRAVRTLRALYDDNAADVNAPGLAREYWLARQWRDEAFSPEVARERRAGIVTRGRSQNPPAQDPAPAQDHLS
jgi:enoyl-CoA hydratase/carnithine racemase